MVPPGSVNPNTALNEKVFESFFNQLVNVHGLVPGVYCSQNQWNSIMGSGYGIPANTPVWSFDNVGACNRCPSSLSGLPTIGGIAPTLWQFAQGCPQDLDVASVLPS